MAICHTLSAGYPFLRVARSCHALHIADECLHGLRFGWRCRWAAWEGVLKTEINRLTLQPGIGLWMNAIPRASTAALL